MLTTGLHLGANIHDASGVNVWEDMYVAMATAMGVDPHSGPRIPFAPLNQTYMLALEDIVMADLVEKGLDFWWCVYGACLSPAIPPSPTSIPPSPPFRFPFLLLCEIFLCPHSICCITPPSFLHS